MPTPPVSGYAMWLDAADSSTITSTASSFEWRDKSSNNFNLTSQGTIGNITYTSSTPASVDFSPNQYLQIDRSTTSPLFYNNTSLKASGGWMIFLVASQTGGDSLKFAVAFSAGARAPTNSDDDGSGIEYAGNILFATTNSWVVNGSSLTTDYNSGWTFFDITRKNSMNVVTSIALAGTSLPNWLCLSSPLYNNSAQNNRFFTGKINEVLVYPAITSSERMQVEAYLANKWGLASVFPASYASLLSGGGGGGGGALACFLAGTRLLTQNGFKAIEKLENTDYLVTSDNRTIDFQLYKTTVQKTDETSAPYKVDTHAFGRNLPMAPLYISPSHKLQIQDGLWISPEVAVKNNSHVTQCPSGETVTYYHVACNDYLRDNVIAEGMVSESFGTYSTLKGKDDVYTWNATRGGFTRKRAGSPAKIAKA